MEPDKQDAKAAPLLSLKDLLPRKINAAGYVLIALAVLGSSVASYYIASIFDRFQRENQVTTSYEEWKKRLSPERQVWENAIRISMDEPFWRQYKRDRVAGRSTCWDYGTVDPARPTVLIIGDSISLGYTDAVRQRLSNIANVLRIPANGGKTQFGLDHLDGWLNRPPYRVIYFNFGIHDRKLDNAVYKANLEKITERLQKTGAKLIFALTTALPQNPALKMDDADIVAKNAIARDLMKVRGVAVDDLYTLVRDNAAVYREPADCHMTAKGYSALGEHVAQTIKGSLGAP